jgi:hypothetical protein
MTEVVVLVVIIGCRLLAPRPDDDNWLDEGGQRPRLRLWW